MSSEDPLFQRFGREFPQGSVLFREGDPGAEMYVVQRGQIRISKRVGEVEKVLSTLGPGEFFGEMSVLLGTPRSATATCTEEARLLVVDARTFEAMLRANGEIAVRMIRKLAERVHSANEQIENLLLPDASMRVAHLILSAAEHRPVAAGRATVAVADLPARLGLPASDANEALVKLSRARVVAVQDGMVHVADPARLRQYLEFLQMKAQFGEGP